MPKKPSLAIIGPGALGSALCLALHDRGYPIHELVARDAAAVRRARKLATRIGAEATTLARATLGADVIWLCVADDAIAPVARRLARRGHWRGKTVLHSSGALSSALLAPVQRRGAAIASLHPMMTFVRGVPAAFHGVSFAVEGEAVAVRLARRVGQDLGGRVIQVRPEAKPLYHALGSFSSPMIVAVLTVAEELAKTAGISQRQAHALMRPILTKTSNNFFTRGAAGAFSGPLLRGDVTTVREHLRAMRAVPGASEVYRALIRWALRSLPVANPQQIAALLKGRGRHVRK